MPFSFRPCLPFYDDVIGEKPPAPPGSGPCRGPQLKNLPAAAAASARPLARGSNLEEYNEAPRRSQPGERVREGGGASERLPCCRVWVQPGGGPFGPGNLLIIALQQEAENVYRNFFRGASGRALGGEAD